MGELATKIRTKFPGAYDSLADDELESKVMAKFPGVYDHLASKPSSRVIRQDASYTEDPAKIERARREFVRTEKANLGTGEKLKMAAADIADKLPTRRSLANLVRPTLEGGGATLGGIIGGGGALIAGNAGPQALVPEEIVTVPAATIAGSSLGFGIGKNIADTIEGNYAKTPTEAATRTLKDLGTGATYEMGGQVAGKMISAGVEKLPQVVSRTPLKDLASTRAKQIIDATSQLTEQEAANLAKGQELTNKLGIKLTPAQMTGKPSLAALEQGLASTDPAFSATLNAQDSAAKAKAISNMRAKVGPSRPLPNTQDVQTIGQNIVDTVKGAQSAAKPIHEELYDSIPNTPQPTGKIKEVIGFLKKDFRPGDEDVFPSRAISRVEEAISGPKPSTVGHHGKPADPVILDAQGLPIRNSIDTTKKEVGFQDLHSLRKDIGRQIQDASTGMKPNRELAAKLTMIKNAIDETIESSMGANNQYQAAKNAFIEYSNKFRTGAVNKVLARGNELSGLRVSDETVAKQFYSPSGADGLIRAVGKKAATEQMRPFVLADMTKDGERFTVESGLRYIQKNRVALEKFGLVGDARQVLKDQFPAEIEKMIAKRAPDPTTGQQFLTSQDMRGILQKYGNTIKQLYGTETLGAFRDYNQLLGMIERKNIVPRGAGSNTAEKAMNVANLMIKESVGPAKKLTDGLLLAIAKGATLGGGATMAAGNISPKVAAIGGTLMAARQMVANGQGIVAQTFTKILKDATLNPQVAKDLMSLQRTGKVPATLQSIIDNHLIGGSAIGVASPD